MLDSAFVILMTLLYFTIYYDKYSSDIPTVKFTLLEMKDCLCSEYNFLEGNFLQLVFF